jgi:hypothetical protein
MEDTHLTPAFLTEVFKASQCICMGIAYSGFLDEATTKLFNVYRALNNFISLKPNEVYIIDNDGTLGIPPIEVKGSVKYSSVISLPHTHEKMKWLISKVHDPTVLALIVTGRKMFDKEYDLSDSNVMAKMIAKNHGIEQFIDRVWTNNLNGHYPTNWTSEIGNEVHKAIMVFTMRIFFPNVNIFQYDDQQKALELGLFAFQAGNDFLKHHNIPMNGKFTMLLVNLDNESPCTELKQENLQDVEKFFCFQNKQR